MKASKFSVRHPVVIGMILIALGAFGLFSLATMNLEFVGAFEMPQVYVAAVWPGASAEDIEDSVINVLEDDFVTLPDFKSISSTSSNSVGIVVISFQDGVKAEDKINEVRARVSELEDDLPSGLSGLPQCILGGIELLPTVTFAAYTDDIGATTSYIEETLKPQLTQIAGVSAIQIDGGTSTRVDVTMRMDDLESKGISPLAVYQMLNYANNSMPLGTSYYEGKSVSVRYDGSFSSLEDIRNLPVGATENKEIIRLKDVADVTLGYQEQDYYISKGSEDALVVSIRKRADGNSVNIAKKVQKILDKSEKDLNGAVHFEMIQEDKTTVDYAMSTVIESGLMGVAIAVLIIFLFLNDPMATLVIGLSIPLSIFFTFIGMKVAGLSINLLSISGIVVALGSIVDASIVVLDETYRFYQHLENGRALYTVTKSIDNGTDKVGLSVLGSNLTTVVVFIPIAMLSGIVGQLLRDISVTFMISILSSLVVAMVFVPWLMKLFLREDDEKRLPKKESLVVKGVNFLEKGYAKAIDIILRDPGFMILIALGVLAITGYAFPQMKMAFIPTTDTGDFYVAASFPYSYDVEETRKGMDKIETLVLDYLPEDSIKTYLTYSGKDPASVISFTNNANEGGMHIVLSQVTDRDYEIHTAINDLQYILSENVPDATIAVSNGGFDRLIGMISNGGGFGLTLIGNDEKELYDEAEKIKAHLLDDPQVLSVSINATYNNVSAVMNTNYDALSSLGLTSYEAGMTTAILFNGLDVGKYRDSRTDDSYDIHLSSDVKDYPINDSLMTMIKLSGAGGKVAMKSVADLTVDSKVSSIHHSDRAKSLTVTAVLNTESTTDVQARMDAWLLDNPLPAGISLKQSGLGELISDALGPIVQALIIGIFLVYMIMVFVFERFNQPIQIMLTTPFCLIGVLLSLTVFRSTMSMVSLLGIVSLAGMLVNNGIILIDSINMLIDERKKKLLKAKGYKVEDMTDKEMLGKLDRETELDILHESTIEGTTSRLRPILMSSLTTILGVVPMAYASGVGSELYAPLGQVIMGGFMTSMIITLFITPVIYSLNEKRRIKKSYRYVEN